MFGAAAVRNKKRKQNNADKADIPRGPYIKPFGPRFDPNELPYFKYKRALAEAKELQQNISRVKKSKQAATQLPVVSSAQKRKPEPVQDKPTGDITPEALQRRMKIPQDGLGTAFPGRQWPPRGPRQKKIEENHAKYRKHKKIEQLDGADGIYRASSSANVILYVGLGMLAIGLVITFVGLGDKGFKTLELKLIGPSLVGCGVFFCLLRVLFCTVPSCCSSCFQCCKSSEEKKALINPQTDAKASSVSNGAGSKKAGLAVVRGSSSESRRRVAPASAGIQENRPHPNFGEENGRENFEKQEGQRESFRQREIRTAKSCTGSIEPAPTNKERPASKSHSDKHAKPLSYDNYSTSGSSEFSFSAVNNTDILRSAEASQAASSENDDKFVNKLASADYPDYNTIPQFPVLNGTPIHQFDQLVTKAELRGGDIEMKSPHSTTEVVMNPSSLRVTTET